MKFSELPYSNQKQEIDLIKTLLVYPKMDEDDDFADAIEPTDEDIKNFLEEVCEYEVDENDNYTSEYIGKINVELNDDKIILCVCDEDCDDDDLDDYLDSLSDY